MQTTTQAFNNLNQNIQPQAQTIPAYQTQNLSNPSFGTTIHQGGYLNQQQQIFNKTGLPSVGPLPAQKMQSGSQVNLINNQGARVLPQSTVSNLNLISGAPSNIQTGIISQAGTTVPPKPTSTSRMEYIPIQRKVVDYETRQVISNMWVPIQRKCLNYYAIQHITEYIPRQVDDVRYEMVPQEYVQYKLQYVPVERQIVHMPHDQNTIHEQIEAIVGQQSNLTGINQEFYNNQNVSGLGTIQSGKINSGAVNTGLINAGNQNTIKTINPTIINTSGTSAVNIPGYQTIPNTRPLPKSNYVTSDGYVPSYFINNYASNLNRGASSLVNPSILTNLKANQQAAYQRNFTQSNSNLRPISIVSQQSRPRETLDDQWGGRYVY